jgi:glycosyltransferase involved in cell wall biosynthesis
MHLVGARHDREKALYCSLGVVNLNPGMVGLGIVDSFALGIPMITTEGSFHSPEIAYLEPGRNGVRTPHLAEEFAGAVARVLSDDAYRAELVAGCRASAARYTIEAMATRFARGVRSAIEAPRRR